MIKNILCLVLLSCTLLSFQNRDEVILDKAEALKIYQLINEVRSNPERFAVDYKMANNLKVKQTRLVWNDTLAKAAEAKAIDMASKNYVEHTDRKGYGMNYYIHHAGYTLNAAWLKNKSTNNFESIAAGYATAEDVVRTLIIDNGTPSFGHRDHLLGIGPWNSTLVDIGVGFARSQNEYATYVSIIIAKHNW